MPRHSVYLTLSLLITLLFVGLVVFFSVNIPQQDDYDSILFYLLGSTENFTNGLADLHVSHRLALTRLLARVSLLWGQGVDFRALTGFGAMCLVGAAGVLYCSVPRIPERRLALLLLCLSLFSLYHWSNMAWATAAVQNYTGLFAAVVCFSLFDRPNLSSRLVAVLLGLVAPYISASGLLILPILLVWSGIESRQTRYHGLLLTGLVGGSLLSFTGYFLLLPSPPGATLAPTLTLASALQVVLAFPVACAGYLHFVPLALVGGLFVNGYFLLLIRLRYDRRNRVLFYTFFYILLSLLLVALFRHDLGSRYLIASRYQVYTLLLNALIAISALELGLDRQLLRRSAGPLLLTGFTLLYLASFYYLGNLHSEQVRLRTGIASWPGDGGESLYYPDPAHAAELLNRAVQASLYRPPPAAEN
ncbi:MAG: hypothetical protein R3F41_02665 [Gammaproteobacteria bacterium]|nr:hypothetical protein [Pseudomonadales bacterium]MCP5345804.1 hypothetical protein [Pseudomonadales bacterium]